MGSDYGKASRWYALGSFFINAVVIIRIKQNDRRPASTESLSHRHVPTTFLKIGIFWPRHFRWPCQEAARGPQSSANHVTWRREIGSQFLEGKIGNSEGSSRMIKRTRFVFDSAHNYNIPKTLPCPGNSEKDGDSFRDRRLWAAQKSLRRSPFFFFPFFFTILSFLSIWFDMDLNFSVCGWLFWIKRSVYDRHPFLSKWWTSTVKTVGFRVFPRRMHGSHVKLFFFFLHYWFYLYENLFL